MKECGGVSGSADVCVRVCVQAISSVSGVVASRLALDVVFEFGGGGGAKARRCMYYSSGRDPRRPRILLGRRPTLVSNYMLS